MRHSFDLDGVSHAVWLSRDARGWTLLAERGSHSVALEPVRHGRFMLTLDGDSDAVSAVVDGDTVHVHLDGRAYALRYRDPVDVHAAESEAGGHDVARAPMPGGVLSVLVAVGATVRAGDTLHGFHRACRCRADIRPRCAVGDAAAERGLNAPHCIRHRSTVRRVPAEPRP
jgi:acetyl/propionyl-CoA carboxylase alpha subunit